MYIVNNVNIKINKLSKIPIEIQKLTYFDGVVLAGGSLRTIIDNNDKICDYDIFFLSEESKNKTVEFLKSVATLKFECPKKELYTFSYLGNKVQLVTKFTYDDIENIINSFDINACRAAMHKGNIYIPKEFIRDVVKKIVTINKITFPVATINRIYKYKRKGYYVSGECLRSVVIMISSQSWDSDKLQLYVD